MNEDFIMKKATNMRILFEPFAKPEHKPMLEEYNSFPKIKELVETKLKPLYATGTLSLASEFFCDQLEITDSELRNKAYRYLECFCELIA